MNRIIDDLQDPAALPEKAEKVEVIQTHISIVFVAGAFVYKIKKPVDFGFLDFSTLDKRRFFCRQEVTLNRRLSEGIYLDVLPVTFDGHRHRIMEAPGRIVEYAVKMKRIPDEVLMKTLFDTGGLTAAHLSKVADILARFHQGALGTPDIGVFGQAERFRVNTDENFAQVAPYVGVSIREKDFYAL